MINLGATICPLTGVPIATGTKSVTYVAGGLVEYGSDGTVISNYGVAVRTTTGNPSATNLGSIVYLHSDHLGSVGVTTDNAGNIAEAERYDPWGKTRSGGITSTEKAFTGQRYDTGTGLLFYNARYYDASLARFVSADSIVPGMEDGKSGSAASLGYDDTQALRPLTVDFHEGDFLSAYGEELRFTANKGFSFQLKDKDKKSDYAKNLWGPKNAQTLNRFAYVLNNPIRYNDPSGHQSSNSTWYDLGDGWTARIDRFNTGNTASHEVHVYRNGQEVGIHNQTGWINKHGKSGAPVGMPQSKINNVNGITVDFMRGQGAIGPKGIDNIHGQAYQANGNQRTTSGWRSIFGRIGNVFRRGGGGGFGGRGGGFGGGGGVSRNLLD